jgi:pyruvate ferredoxin oxidoreductase alpha subunit
VSVKELAEKAVALTGNEAAAYGMRQCNPDVVAAYPITPQTEVVQIYSSFVADGLVDTRMVTVESEHSAMSACAGASAAGARVMTATSSQGLALMWEILYIAAGLRLPIVMPVTNRALSAPINIHCDHSDTTGARDSGWIQFHCENCQEIYESVIQAMKLAEREDIRLPAMVNYDGFITSHGMEPVIQNDEQKVRKWLGIYKPKYSLLDVDNPISIGCLDLQDYYFEHKRSQQEPVFRVIEAAKEVSADYAKTFGGPDHGIYTAYMMEDAEVAVVAAGSTCGTARITVDELRADGMKAGLLKIRLYRPFPYTEIAGLLSKTKAVAILDRADSQGGFGGPLFTDIRCALYDAAAQPPVVDYVYGLGGRDIKVHEIKDVYGRLKRIADGGAAGDPVSYLGVRE